MADWSNIRVLVAGPRRAIAALRREARPFLRFAKGSEYAELPKELEVDDPLFDLGMLHGEGGNLFEYTHKRLAVGAVVQHAFQIARGDEVAHFKKVSRRFPALRFVVGWGHTSCDEYGSALISQGRAKKRKLTSKKSEEIYRKYIPNPDDHGEGTSFLEWEAEEEMIDHCMEFWNEEVFQDGGKRRVRPQAR